MVAMEDSLYVFGGMWMSGYYTKTVEKLNISNDNSQWEQLPSTFDLKGNFAGGLAEVFSK